MSGISIVAAATRRKLAIVAAAALTIAAAACTPPTQPALTQITVTASSATVTYGDPVPAITPSYVGFPAGQTAPTTPPVCTVTAPATPNLAVGTYQTTCAGAHNSGQKFVYVAGTLTITPAPVVVTASSATMPMGGAVPTITAGYNGLVGGQTVPATLPTCITNATPSSPTGTYASSCSGAADPNYTFTYVDGTVEVTEGSVAVTASSATITYGDPIPAISATYAGLTGGQTAPATPATCTTTATAASTAGTYPTTCTGAADANYSFTYVAGTLTIAPAPVVVTASSASISVGDPIPAISATYSGLVGGQTAPATPATCTTTATAASAAGTYATTCTGAADPNATFTYIDGTLTIAPAPVVVTASSATMTYGDAAPAITPTYSGLIGVSTPATTATCTTTATSTSPVGSYPATCSGAADPNHSFTYVAGSVAVQQAAATITASSATMTYGDPAPTITATYSGLRNGQSAAATAPVCTTTATAASPVGTYTSSCSGAADPNHTFTYVAGTVGVDPAAATVTGSSPSVVYGAAIAAITPLYTGLRNGAVATATPAVCTTTATSGASAGTYPTTCSGAADPNYTISYSAGTLTITKAPVVVTASSGAMITATAPPAITATYSGLIGVASPATPATCTTAASTWSPAGTYTSSCSGAADPNHSFTYVAGSVLVRQGGFAEYTPNKHTTTLDAAVNGATLPRGTINVASTAGFETGYLNISVQTSAGMQSVFCKGTTATSFTSCTGGTGTMSTGGYVVDAAPSVFDVYTISGGKAAVSPTSLTILGDVPSAARGVPSSVTASADNGLITYVQSANPTGTHVLTFGICAAGTPSYSAGDPACWTNTISYGPGVAQQMGAKVQVSIVSSNVYQTVSASVQGPATVAQGSTFTAYAAPAAAAIPKYNQSSVGDATVNSASGFTAIIPIPNGMTYVGAAVLGGDATSAGNATIKYCPATGTGCTAKLTGNYSNTTLPYLQLSLPGKSVPGGGTLAMPAVALTLQATGPVGTVSQSKLTEFLLSTSVNAPIIGNVTANFDGYPTTGNNTGVTPPAAPATVLATATITAP